MFEIATKYELTNVCMFVCICKKSDCSYRIERTSMFHKH